MEDYIGLKWRIYKKWYLRKLTVKLFLVMFYDIHRGTTLIKGICSFGNWVGKKRNFRTTDIGMHVHCFEASYLPALLK